MEQGIEQYLDNIIQIINFFIILRDKQQIIRQVTKLTLIIMNKQDILTINNSANNRLNQQLKKIAQVYPPPKPLEPILQILSQLEGTANQSPTQLQKVIDQLCGCILNLEETFSKIDEFNKQQQIEVAFKKFVSFPHYKEIIIKDNQEQGIKNYREIMGKYFHYFIHRTTLKNTTKLFIIFFRFLSLQLLDVKIVNLFFLVLILSHENLSPKNDIKYIKLCLRNLYRNQIIYIGSSLNELPTVKKSNGNIPINKHLYKNYKPISLSFGILAYIIFFGNVEKNCKTDEQTKLEQTKMIQKIISNPIQITSIILEFRNQFPQSEVYQCLRDIKSLSTTIIDSYFLKSILGIYLDYKLQPIYKQCTFNIVQNLVKFNLSQNTVKSMIKKLQITDSDDLQEQWKNVFQLLKTTLPEKTKILTKKSQTQSQNYKIQEDSPKKQVQQQQSSLYQSTISKPAISKIIEQKNLMNLARNSYLAYTLQHQFNGFFIAFKSYRISEEYILLKLKNQQHQIWVFIRHLYQSKFLLSLIKLMGNNTTQMSKQQIQWKPFEKHYLQCELEDDNIVFKFGAEEKTYQQQKIQQSNQVKKKIKVIKMKNIKPKQIILGSKQKDIPVYPCQISNFDIKYCQGKITYNFIFLNKNKMNKFSSNVKMLSTSSLTKILKKLGQLDLFVLITSHLIRKVQNEESLKKMLKQVINFLECLVIYKGVSGVKLTQKEKEERFYNVRSLVWLGSRYKRDPGVMLEVLRFLCIRGIKKPLDHLQILSNIGLWKQISSQQHLKVIQKIKQNCLQVPKQRSTELLQMMKKTILDFIIFYKDTFLVCQSLQEDYLLKRSQIMKLVYEIVSLQKTFQVIDFILFLLKILYLILDKTKNNIYIDVTIGFELTTLAYRLLYFTRQDQYKSMSKDRNKIISKKTMKSTRNQNFHPTKSMNLQLRPINVDRDQQSLSLKIEQSLAWIHQIMYFFKKQVLVKQNKIKFCDWDWDYKHNHLNRSSLFLNNKFSNQQKSKSVSQTKILTLFEHIQIGLMSFNKEVFNQLVLQQLTPLQWQIYWHMNLFDEKICSERFIQTLKIGNFNTITWDDHKVESFLTHSFDLTENGKKIAVPSSLIETIKIKDIDIIHHCLLGIYLHDFQQKNLLQKQQCSQNIMYILAILPDSLYSNTQLLRQQLNKQKRNNKTVYLIQKHLIVKQLTRQGFKLMHQLRNNQFKELTSTILAFQDINANKNQNSQTNQNQSKVSSQQERQEEQIQQKNIKKNKSNTQDLSVFINVNVQYQQSFLQGTSQNQNQRDNISTQKIKQSLQHFKLLANPSEIAAFYKIPNSGQNKKQYEEQIQGLILNFNINIDSIIKILQQSCSSNEKISQLQSYIFFIEKHIFCFSKMIITEYLFNQIKTQNNKIRQKRKKSYVQAGYRFKQQSEDIFEQFLKQRRKSVYKMQNIWWNIQKNNKDFWHIFFKSEKKNQSIDQMCNSMKLKGLIKIDCEKKQIQLPKNLTTISNKFSISGDSDKDLVADSFIDNPHFGDIAIYQQQQSFEKEQNMRSGLPIHGKDINNLLHNKKTKNQFLVLFVTTTKIYQGLLIICNTNFIRFQEDKVPDESFYDIVCANQNERRASHQIQKKREQFEIILSQKSTIIPKRYLYYDSAIQVYSQKLSYFFVFRKNAKRQQFLNLLSNLKGTIKNQQQLIQNANKQMQRWMNGDISNYTYLMHLNDLSGRSFNDMSQYYIFPWIITNYKSQKFNKKFLNNQKNYRDLSKPVGALNKKRLDQLLNRYKESNKYEETQSYLYGSYCSNPAIVCNYLVRLQPFSMHHYLLQSKQFDLADRIFYSILNQFNCSYNNMGDYKQLIPQFFSCPEFLRNRNKYKFGQKQNKQIVNNVQLPQWAHYQFNSTRKSKQINKTDSFQVQQQFVFRMRKCLQSGYVTGNLHQWIDLMFGPYIQKQRAMERYNLYISIIYKNQLSKTKNNKNKQTCLMFFKEFGQMPRDLFDRDHKTYKNNKSYYKIANSQAFTITQITTRDKCRKYYKNDQYLIYYDDSNINLVQIKGKSTEHNILAIPSSEKIKQLKLISIQYAAQDKKADEKQDFIIYLKSGKLALRQLATSTFRKKLEVKQEKESSTTVETKFEIMQIYQDQKEIIVVEQDNYRIYSYNLQTNNVQKSSDIQNLISLKPAEQDQTITIAINKKTQLKFSLEYQFTHHKSKIQHLRICPSYGLLISIDSNRKVYIFKLRSKQRQIVQFFRLKKLTNCQTIIQMEAHQMGYIIILTSLNNIHMYNLMGDHVASFSGNTIKQINKKMRKKQLQKKQNEKYLQSNIIPGKQSEKVKQKVSSEIEADSKIESTQIEIQQSQFEGENTIINEQIQNRQNLKALNNQATINANKKKEIVQQTQVITTFQIWSHESCQLIVGTQSGNLYRFDLFMIDDCQKINLTTLSPKTKNKKEKQKKQKIKTDDNKSAISSEKIQHITVNRIGRHWQCWICSCDKFVKIESEDYRNAFKRNEQYRKKYVLP